MECSVKKIMWQIKEELTDIKHEYLKALESHSEKMGGRKHSRDISSKHSRNNESKQSSHLKSPINFMISKSRKIDCKKIVE